MSSCRQYRDDVTPRFHRNQDHSTSRPQVAPKLRRSKSDTTGFKSATTRRILLHKAFRAVNRTFSSTKRKTPLQNTNKLHRGANKDVLPVILASRNRRAPQFQLKRSKSDLTGFASRNNNNKFLFFNGFRRGVAMKKQQSIPAMRLSSETISNASTKQPPKANCSRQYPMGNHLWVNTERQLVSLEPLRRNITLDQLAREKAGKLAEYGDISRASVDKPDSGCKKNCLVGPSMQTVHKLTMSFDCQAKCNILDSKFQEFGMGTVKGKHDDNLYIVQLFSSAGTI